MNRTFALRLVCGCLMLSLNCLSGCGPQETTMPEKPVPKPPAGAFKTQGASNGSDGGAAPASGGTAAPANNTPQGGAASLPPVTVD